MSLEQKRDQFLNEAIPTDPLRAPTTKAAPYPVEALGDVLGNAAKTLQKTVKAPMALCCQSVLAAASLAAQAHFDIMLPWGERKPLSLFLLTVALSGERKTTIDRLVLGAAKAQEREDLATYEVNHKDYEEELAHWKAENEKRNKKQPPKNQATSDYEALTEHEAAPKPEAPIMPLRFIEDPTAEGLYKLLAVGQPSIGMFSDEGALVIGGYALSKDNSIKTMAMWCKLWDGSNLTRVRAGEGASALYSRRMSMHLQAQPEVMDKLLNDLMANSQGFLARGLVAWPESTIGTRHVETFERAEHKPELKRLFAVLKGLTEAEPRTTERSKQELDPIELPLANDEVVAFALHAVNQFESLMKSGNDLCELTDRASKAVEIACRIAGILAVIEGGMATRSISKGHLQNSLILMQWYLEESLRIRSVALIPLEVKHAEMLVLWLKERDIKLFNTSMILTKGSNQLRSKARLDPAIKVLMDNGYLQLNDPGTLIEGKKSRTSWRILSYVV
jgi:putative DNA primase/helicase